MANLEISSKDRSIIWRVPLQSKPMRIGRMQGLVEIVTPPQDNFISRIHATVEQRGPEELLVTKHAEAGNPIYRVEPGKPPVSQDEFIIKPGESFQIGSTVFKFCCANDDDTGTAEQDKKSVAIMNETAYTPEKLRGFRFLDANHRVDALADLPQLILSTQHERMLEQQVLDTLLKGIPEADMVAIVRLDPESREEDPRVQTLAIKSREQSLSQTAEHRPSRKLVHNAIRYLSPTHHEWMAGNDMHITQIAGMDWAMCVPLPDAIAPDMGLYVTGKLRRLMGPGSDPGAKDKQFQGDLKFTQITADIFAALRRMLELQNQQRTLSRFLPMPIVAMMRGISDLDEFLQARECDITVLFCDLRGSCRFAESGTDLRGLLAQLSEALGLMTDSIVSRSGVIGDFQGDAVMAFWGWPRGERQVERAAEAALQILRRFRDLAGKSGSLHGVGCGIGIAHGRGVAGRLGTADQFKVGAFGPVVNLASRLEGLTKAFRVSMLVDGNFATLLPEDPTIRRKRRVAKVKPAGMDTAVELYELLPPEQETGALPDHLRLRYERAMDAFITGRWREAGNMIANLPDTDGPSAFLKKYIADHGATAPPGWDGTIVMQSK